MKKLILMAVLLAASTVANAQMWAGIINGYNDAQRKQQQYDQEQQLRQLQIDRMRAGNAPDPQVQQQLDTAAGQRIAEDCRMNQYFFNGKLMQCRECPSQHTTTCYQ